MKKRVADIITEVLAENGINTCFSVVGGGAMHLNNAFALNENIRTIYNHHEQACSMAAEGYARLSGKMAAVCVTSGPGAVNAMNGVQGAWVDSIPMIVISGHPRYETTVASTGLDLRCRGVQENDTVYAVKKITKYCKLITNPLEIRYEVQKAIDIAMEGRRGPVWLDIPLNVQGAIVSYEDLLPSCESKSECKEISGAEIETVNKLLNNADRPCVLTGSGIRTGNSIEHFRGFLEKVKIPVVGGALQADICYNGQENYFGMSGSMGPRPGNFILQNADVIIVLGNSLSFKQTGFNQEEFAKDAKIIMIDAQEDEGKKPGLNVAHFIHADLKHFFEMFEKYGDNISADPKWFDYCKNVKRRFQPYEALVEADNINDDDRVPVLLFWKKFMERNSDNRKLILALGNSSCVHGVLQEGVENDAQRVLVNYNCGSMGDDLTEAIGAAVVDNNEVYCVTGDGSIMMNLQELQTIKHYGLKIKIILFLNEGYGALRSTWSKFFDGKYAGCDKGSGVSFPEFKDIVNAFGIEYFTCNTVKDLDEGLSWLEKQNSAAVLGISQRIDDIKGPKLESKMLDDGTFITPALHDMSPFISKEEMDELMLK